MLRTLLSFFHGTSLGRPRRHSTDAVQRRGGSSSNVDVNIHPPTISPPPPRAGRVRQKMMDESAGGTPALAWLEANRVVPLRSALRAVPRFPPDAERESGYCQLTRALVQCSETPESAVSVH